VPGAWFGAALWALHPVQVESVAWVAEMKNTESGLFFLMTIFFFLKWLRYADGRNWALMIGCAALAMLCKASTIILPVVLCLCAWWMEGHLRRRSVLAVLPLIFMGLTVTLLSMGGQQAQMANAATFQQSRNWPERIISAGDAAWFYLGKLAWPHPLAAIYPRWPLEGGNWFSYLPGVAVVAVLALLWRLRHSGGRPFFFGFAYFLIALLPVLGFAENTIFRYAFVFDHLQYLASMGPLALVGAGAARIWGRTKREERWLPFIGGAAILVLLGAETWQRTLVYLGPKSYWTDAMAKNSDSWLVHYNLGDALESDGDRVEALAQYRAAKNLKPATPGAYERIGSKLTDAGFRDEAIASYRAALDLAPNYYDAQVELANTLSSAGRHDEAIAAYRHALQLKADDDAVHANFGAVLFEKGRFDDAIAEYRKALALNPHVASTHDNLAVALLQTRQVSEAISECQRTLDVDPTYPEGHYRLGNALLSAGRIPEAIAQYQAELALDPDSAKTHNNLGIAQAQSNRPDEAETEFEKALQLQPGFAEAQKNLDLAKAAAARLKAAPQK
jgi:tetratricopeptide (TPR) repeat protein